MKSAGDVPALWLNYFLRVLLVLFLDDELALDELARVWPP